MSHHLDGSLLGNFEIDLTPGIKIEADPLRLKQVIENLVSNAIKYGEDKLEISLPSIKSKYG